MMRHVRAVLLLLLLLIPWECGAALVEQPLYGGMRFHVYKPANAPTGWYATYDGYPVFKGKDGVWYYGSREGAGIVQTGYAVGSVVPSVVGGLKPWTAVTPVAPVYSGGQAGQGAGLVPGAGSVPQPGWTRNPRFLAIEKWRGSVDRVGVLNKPVVPVAWKGEHPKVIYVWTGQRWHQVLGKEEGMDRPLAELRRKFYDLTVEVNRSEGGPWGYEDMAILARYAAAWGYRWMGQLPVVDQYGRPGVPYGRY